MGDTFSISRAVRLAKPKSITIADIAKARGGEMLRALRRCKGAGGRVMHSLDLYCDEPDGDGAPLGFVR